MDGTAASGREHQPADSVNSIFDASAPPSSVSLSNRLMPRPLTWASLLVMTGGSCLWSPMSAT